MKRPLIIISITGALLLVSVGIGYALLSNYSTTEPPPQNTSPADTAPTETPPPLYAGLENPFSWDDVSAQEAGKEEFDHSCAGCHAAPSKAVADRGVDFYAVDYRQSLEERPDFYFWVVSEGRLDTLMPPLGAVFSE